MKPSGENTLLGGRSFICFSLGKKHQLTTMAMGIAAFILLLWHLPITLLE